MKDIKVNNYFATCSCMCHGHIMTMTHFPPLCGQPEDESDREIYATVNPEICYNTLFPPIRYFYSIEEWKSFFRYHFFNRFIIAFKYLFNSGYIHKWGLGAGDVEDRRLDELKEFLKHITSSEDHSQICVNTDVWLDAGRYALRFTIEKIDPDYPYQLGWEIQFPRKQGLWKRIESGWRYIWGMDGSERSATIKPMDAEKIRDMIIWIQDNNTSYH